MTAARCPSAYPSLTKKKSPAYVRTAVNAGAKNEDAMGVLCELSVLQNSSCEHLVVPKTAVNFKANAFSLHLMYMIS